MLNVNKALVSLSMGDVCIENGLDRSSVHNGSEWRDYVNKCHG